MKRSLPFVAVAVALLVASWWGLDTFVLSDDALDEGGGADPIVLEPVVRSGPGAEHVGAVRIDFDTLQGPTQKAPFDAGRTVDAASPPEEEVDAPAPAPTPTSAGVARPAVAPRAERSEPEAPEGGGRPGGVTTGSSRDETRVSSGVTAPGEETWVRPGIAWIGTPTRTVDGMLGARDDGQLRGLAYEAPRYAVTVGGFYVERTEVTNQRYRRFLREAAGVEFRTPVGRAETLMEIVTLVVGPRAPEPWDLEATARQLYETNRAVLHGALPGLVVMDPQTRNLDEEATWAQVAEARIPKDLNLRFYDRAPPRTWPDWTFEAGDALRPVRDLSLEDANALALWAGRHVPSELEWEYAARGPQGQDLPWGDRSVPWEEVVNGGTRLDRDEVPETVPVSALQRSASWVGCWQMLGNVAEWTSSWIEPYPDSGLGDIRPPHAVDRGGSAFNQDRLALRSAFRGFTARERELDGLMPPTAHRWWTGARLARYEEPARSRTVCMHTAVRIGGRVDASALETVAYAGVEGQLVRRTFESRQDPSVRMGTKAVVVQPLTAVCLYDRAADAWVPGVGEGIQTPEQLHALSDIQPVLLGLFHVDLQALHVYGVGEDNRRGDPKLKRMALPPGTWVLALDRGYLAAIPPSFAGKIYLTRRPVREATLNLLARGPSRGPNARALPLAKLIFDPRTGGARFEVITPLGNPAEPRLAARTVFRLQLEKALTNSVTGWEADRLPK